MIEIKADDGMMTVHVRGSEDYVATEACLLLRTAVKIMKELDFDKRYCRMILRVHLIVTTDDVAINHSTDRPAASDRMGSGRRALSDTDRQLNT